MVPSSSDAFPLSGSPLRTRTTPQVARSFPEATEKHFFLHNPRAGKLLFLVVFLVSGLYTAKELKHGWIPFDEGTLGLSADYVLHGAVPHRDYFEGYTGGLTYVNALAFRIFGANSVSMRYMMFGFFLLWVPTVYYVASRFVSGPAAAVLTFLAVAWGPPNYTAPLPSWYNLFFATFGLAALLRYVHVQKIRWLVLAGLCGGFSFLFKITGLYFVAAAVLALLFRENVANVENSGLQRRDTLYRIFLCAALLICEVFILFTVLRKPSLFAFLYFLIPCSFIAGVILFHELSFPKTRGARFPFLLRELLPFLTGAAIPVVLFLAPFIRIRALQDFLWDVFVMPGRQIAHAAITPPLLIFAVGAIGNVALIFGVFLAQSKHRRRTEGLILLGMAFALTFAFFIPQIHRVIWCVIWVLLPTAAIAGSLMLVRRFSLNEMTSEDSQKLFLVLSVSTLSGLVQFPTIFPSYFPYVAPLLVLAVAAVVSLLNYQPRFFLAGAYCFVLSYVMFEVTPGFLHVAGQGYEPNTDTVTTGIDRLGGIRISAFDAQTYETLGVIIRQHARGEYIFATPDCPEVYYLYGFRNPTRFFFDYHDEPQDRTQRVLQTIRDRHINLVVINGHPIFSGNISSDLRSAFEQEFPNRADTGTFEVRWKP